jgi:hypothetical protein
MTAGIMRLNAEFQFGDRQYKIRNADIGDTINPDWYAEEAGVNGCGHQWSAIHHELPDLYAALETVLGDAMVEQYEPAEFGFIFASIEEGK